MSCAVPRRFMAIRWTSALCPSSPYPAHCLSEAALERTNPGAAVYGDPEWPELMRQLPGQADYRVFCRAIGLDAGERRGETCARADVDDPAAAGSLHARRYSPAQREGGMDVDREKMVPIGVRHLLDRSHLLSGDAAGIVDQHIHRATCCPLDLYDPCRRCGAVGQVQHLCLDSSLRGFRKFRGG